MPVSPHIFLVQHQHNSIYGTLPRRSFLLQWDGLTFESRNNITFFMTFAIGQMELLFSIFGSFQGMKHSFRLFSFVRMVPSLGGFTFFFNRLILLYVVFWPLTNLWCFTSGSRLFLSLFTSLPCSSHMDWDGIHHLRSIFVVMSSPPVILWLHLISSHMHYFDSTYGGSCSTIFGSLYILDLISRAGVSKLCMIVLPEIRWSLCWERALLSPPHIICSRKQSTWLPTSSLECLPWL